MLATKAVARASRHTSHGTAPQPGAGAGVGAGAGAGAGAGTGAAGAVAGSATPASALQRLVRAVLGSGGNGWAQIGCTTLGGPVTPQSVRHWMTPDESDESGGGGGGGGGDTSGNTVPGDLGGDGPLPLGSLGCRRESTPSFGVFGVGVAPPSAVAAESPAPSAGAEAGPSDDRGLATSAGDGVDAVDLAATSTPLRVMERAGDASTRAGRDKPMPASPDLVPSPAARGVGTPGTVASSTGRVPSPLTLEGSPRVRRRGSSIVDWATLMYVAAWQVVLVAAPVWLPQTCAVPVCRSLIKPLLNAAQPPPLPPLRLACRYSFARRVSSSANMRVGTGGAADAGSEDSPPRRPSLRRHLSLDSHGSSLSSGVVTTQGTESLRCMAVSSPHVRCTTTLLRTVHRVRVGACLTLVVVCVGPPMNQGEVILAPGRNEIRLAMVAPLPGVFSPGQVSMSVGHMRFVTASPPPGVDKGRATSAGASAGANTTAGSSGKVDGRSASDAKKATGDMLVVAQRRDPVLLFCRQPVALPASYVRSLWRALAPAL